MANVNNPARHRRHGRHRAGPDHAAMIGAGGVGNHYTSIQMGNIYVLPTPDGQVAIPCAA